MNRSEHAWGSTSAIVAVAGLFCVVAYIEFDKTRIRYNSAGLPAWEAAVEKTQEVNLFWEHAAERADSFDPVAAGYTSEYPNSWADYAFAWDVYTLHVDQTPEAEALFAARNRLNGFDESRTYDGARYVELGFASKGTLNENQLVPQAEFITQVQTLHSSGLDSVLTELPPKPEAPVYFAVTVWNWVRVSPRWLVVWVGMSWIFFVIHATTRKQEPLKGFSLYGEIVSVPGEPVSRAILFVQTFWAIAFIAGLGAIASAMLVSARGINTASDRLKEMRHPNRAEIRRARRAIKTLKRDGAAPELTAKAEDILRLWSIVSTDDAPLRHEKPKRRDRRLAAAAGEVANLRQELEADREATAAARPQRATAKQ